MPSFAPDSAADNDGFDPQLFGRLVEVEDGSFWFRSRSQLLEWALRRYFPDARSLLEIGCGTGVVLGHLERQLPQLTLTGSDLHASCLAVANRRAPRATMLQIDGRRLPFEEEFDVVSAFDVLEHIEDDLGTLRQLARAARPGGGLLVTVPQHRWLWSAADDHFLHKRRYGRRDLVDAVSRAGFTVRRVTSFVSLLLPLMAASRVRQRSTGAEYDPLAEHDVTPGVSRALEAILGVERMLIRTGVSFPIGGSLLVVGQRP